MKIIEKIALGVCALALCGGVFFSCSNAASSGSGLTGGTGSTDSAGTGTGNGTGSGAATIQYTEVWSGSKTIDWDANGLTMDHALFTADFDALRVTFNASEGGFKMAACEPWTVITLTDTSISSGSIGADGTFYLPTGDAQTVTIKLSAADVALIKGQEHDGAWGGLKIFGATTVTLTKVESFKQSSSGTEQTQTTNGGEQTQTQSGGEQQQTQTTNGGEQAQTQETATVVWTGSTVIGWNISESGEYITSDKVANAKGIRVTYTTDDSDSHCFKFLQGDTWTDITLGSVTGDGTLADSSAGTDEGKAVWLSKNQTDAVVSVYWTAGSEDETKVRTKGIKVYGDGATLTKIEVLK